MLLTRDFEEWWYSKRNGLEAFVLSVENKTILKDVVADTGPKVPLRVLA